MYRVTALHAANQQHPCQFHTAYAAVLDRHFTYGNQAFIDYQNPADPDDWTTCAWPQLPATNPCLDMPPPRTPPMYDDGETERWYTVDDPDDRGYNRYDMDTPF